MDDEKIKNIEVETFASDLAGIVGENQDGVVKKIIEEQEEKEKEKTSPEQKRNTFFLAGSVVLFIFAFATVFLVFLLKEDIFITEIKPQYSSIIFTDQVSFQDITGLKKEEIFQVVSNKVNGTLVKKGGLEAIYLKENETILGLRRFLALVEANLDTSKIDFVNDNFLLGVANEEEKDFFILLKMRSMVDIFATMRSWENKMFLDLHSFFNFVINSENQYLLEKNFEDGVVKNKNARILRNNEGEIVMMYIFAENDSLVITNSEQAAAEIMLRLASSQIKK